MIKNDNEFQEVFKEYAESKGVDYDSFCLNVECVNCDFGKLDVYCTRTPFKRIEECEEKIRQLKQYISIMSTWKREREMAKELKDICRTFRGVECTSLSDLTCYGITCDKCPFKDMDNFKEWARKTKEESIGEDE